MNSTRCVLSLVLLACLAAAGCKKEQAGTDSPRASDEATMAKPAEPAPSPGERSELSAALAAADAPGARTATPGAPPTEASDVVALGGGGKAKVMPGGAKTVADTPSYTVTLAAPAQVGKGAQGTVMLEVQPKPGWKLNKEFPTKLTVTEPAGVKVAKKEQTVADAVSFAEKSGKWQVQFQADSAGGKDFTGVFKFAVCTETSCDPKKEQLAWNVAVNE
jgi:hypothetical protein